MLLIYIVRDWQTICSQGDRQVIFEQGPSKIEVTIIDQNP